MGDQELVFECFSFWAANAHEKYLHRNLMETQKALVSIKEKISNEKTRLMERFGENAMAQVKKMINTANLACLQHTLAEWIRIFKENMTAARQQCLLEQQRSDEGANAERVRQQKLTALNRSFGVAGKALLATCMGGWK